VLLLSFEKLNKLAADYYTTRSQDCFRALYDEANRVFQTQNRGRVCSSGHGDRNDADSILNDVIIKLTQKEALNGFGSQMSTALKNARIDWYRKEKTRGKHYELTVDKDDEDAPTSEVPDEMTTEDIVLQRHKKKEADQRKLIDFLSDPRQVDKDTTRIVSSFSQYESVTALAKALGLHHEVAKRKIQRLARRYDANRFGDVSEYLAV
jgi:DNA-directed RNA polymerase specialized sigma24 family protein